MRLSKNANGQVGRHIPGVGESARVTTPAQGDRRGNVYLSLGQIAEDDAYWTQKENEARAIQQATAVKNIIEAKAQELKAQAAARSQDQFQKLAKFDPMNAKLKNFFAKRQMMGETAQVADSVLPGQVATYGRDLSAAGAHLPPPAPADFSASGGNLDYVDGLPMTGGDQWRADWRTHAIKGNPLTRDGVFGPGVTDYERFIDGIDVNQTDVVNTTSDIAGGTMLGRWNDSVAPQGPAGRRLGRGMPPGSRALPGETSRRSRLSGGMGLDLSWDGISDAASDIVDQTGDNLVDSLPDALAKQLQSSILGGGKVTGTSGGVITVQRPPTTTKSAISSLSASTGLPAGAIYAFLGLFAVGVLFIGVRAVKG